MPTYSKETEESKVMRGVIKKRVKCKEVKGQERGQMCMRGGLKKGQM